ncbi:phospho-sugar mutase [Thalassobacillus pellis]|uniref:phospho-sugar mutase n=1 Tax=Thalassobacillus pellis TaxID=748008 RepID=UPI0019619F7E|nr:phospho-sugar mutase [Thalassobacillus pellis]MBM7551454.1 phosphoglucomutase [Thalassobacillus pellis]
MTWHTSYHRWNEFDTLEADLKSQLDSIQSDEQSLEDAFYKNLEFGTGGMRGKLGPGTNRMNIYTIRRAAEGLARYITEQGQEWKERGIAIAYDSRYNSKTFAVEAARVLGANGIKSYVFTSLRPTPELSFAVRFLHAAGGIVITASHNPPEYNGFKVYNEDGGQMPPVQAGELVRLVNQVENELTIAAADQDELEEKGLLEWIDKHVDDAYLKELRSVNLNPHITYDMADDFQVVFTPLHGTASFLVEEGFKQAGLKNIHIVEEQAEPDPEFPTVSSPNPEEHQAFEMAIEQGRKIGADVLIGTDPDADRLGVAVPDGNGSYTVLTGNQLGALMLDYLLSQQSDLPDNGILIKTIVTSEFGRKIASHYEIETLDTLTGFKYIGEKIREYERTGEYEFLFGYEESYGYLVKDFARDKDAVQAAMLAAEIGVFWKTKGKTLLEALHNLFDRYGYYLEDLKSIKLEGKEGAEKIKSIMEDFRNLSIEKVDDLRVVAVEDYASSKRMEVDTGQESDISLPKENVLKFILEDDCWFCLRPSGTEPKIKFYYAVTSATMEESKKRLHTLKQFIDDQLNKLV